MCLKYVAVRSVGTGRIPLLLPGLCQVLLVLECWLLQRRLGTLYYLCVDVRHMIQDCIQTVLHRLQCVLLIYLGGVVILDQIAVWALWAGRMLQPAQVSTSQLVCETGGPLDCDTHRGLMCSVSLSWIWWTLAVVLRHFIGAFACSFVMKYGVVYSLWK